MLMMKLPFGQFGGAAVGRPWQVDDEPATQRPSDAPAAWPRLPAGATAEPLALPRHLPQGRAVLRHSTTSRIHAAAGPGSVVAGTAPTAARPAPLAAPLQLLAPTPGRSPAQLRGLYDFADTLIQHRVTDVVLIERPTQPRRSGIGADGISEGRHDAMSDGRSGGAGGSAPRRSFTMWSKEFQSAEVAPVDLGAEGKGLVSWEPPSGRPNETMEVRLRRPGDAAIQSHRFRLHVLWDNDLHVLDRLQHAYTVEHRPHPHASDRRPHADDAEQRSHGSKGFGQLAFVSELGPAGSDRAAVTLQMLTHGRDLLASGRAPRGTAPAIRLSAQAAGLEMSASERTPGEAPVSPQATGGAARATASGEPPLDGLARMLVNGLRHHPRAAPGDRMHNGERPAHSGRLPLADSDARPPFSSAFRPQPDSAARHLPDSVLHQLATDVAGHLRRVPASTFTFEPFHPDRLTAFERDRIKYVAAPMVDELVQRLTAPTGLRGWLDRKLRREPREEVLTLAHSVAKTLCFQVPEDVRPHVQQLDELDRELLDDALAKLSPRDLRRLTSRVRARISTPGTLQRAELALRRRSRILNPVDVRTARLLAQLRVRVLGSASGDIRFQNASE